ncbi:MAG: type II toxin-antitoxin system RelE/ParE family toxin [Sulfuriferula sp.]|nr:type II toxin-antitoxin system RelE/ParE family toxin [Sulfuriferula sp.]
MRIVLSAAAEADIEHILLYYSEKLSFDVAQLLVSSIFSQLEALSDFPERIRPSERVSGARELVLRRIPYIAFVRLNTQAAHIEVLNIVHTARNFPA